MRVLLLMILAVFSLSVSAQTITATGNVKDATGDPIDPLKVLKDNLEKEMGKPQEEEEKE